MNSRRNEKEKKKESGVLYVFRELLSISLYVLAVLAITWLVKNFAFTKNVVVGNSMQNTLENGDNLIVDRLAYRFHAPKRFDIVVFPYMHQSNTYYIKRIIGLPGETVRIDENGTIYINDHALDESYGREVIKDPGRAAGGITLGENEYFVLGDNRNDSVDSRVPDVGNIKKKNIVGKAVFRIWPLDRAGKLGSR